MAGIHTPEKTTLLLDDLRQVRPNQNWRDVSNENHACDCIMMAQRGNVCYLFLHFSGRSEYFDTYCNGTWRQNLTLTNALEEIDRVCNQERIIERGTIIRITKPYDRCNWSSEMDSYVGELCTVSRVSVQRTAWDDTHTQCEIIEDRGRFTWVLEQGHFIVHEWTRRVQNIVWAPSIWPDYVSQYDYSDMMGTTTNTPSSLPIEPKYPDRTPIVGDWVQITKSKTHWGVGMNDYIGMYFKVSHVNRDYTPARYTFEDMPYDMKDFKWEYKSKHFKKVSKPKVVEKRPLVLSKSFKQFLESIYHESRLARILITALNYQEYGHVGQRSMASKIITGQDVSYLTFRTDGTISYLPKGKECIFTSDKKWANEGRQSGKPAKVLRKVFTVNALRLFKEADFEIFNNKYKARFSTEGFKFEVLPHDKIADVYNILRDDRADGDSSLNNSCMNADYDSDRSTDGFFEIYTKCDKASIIKLTDKDGKLAGRALLWRATRKDTGEEIIFMDRIYVAKDHLYEAFVEFANDNKYWYKKYYKSREHGQRLIDPDGEERLLELKIETDTDCDGYPYIDTFYYGNDGVIRNWETSDNRYIYCNTTGTRDDNGEPEVWDDIAEEDIPERFAVRVTVGEFRDRITHVDNTVTIGGRVYWREDNLITYSEYYEKYITKAGSVYIEYLDTMVKLTDATQVTAGENEGKWILSGDAKEVDGQIYWINDEVVTKQ